MEEPNGLPLVKTCASCTSYRSFSGKLHTWKMCFHPSVRQSARFVNVINGEVRYRYSDLECSVARSNGTCDREGRYHEVHTAEPRVVKVDYGLLWWKRVRTIRVDTRHFLKVDFPDNVSMDSLSGICWVRG